MRRSPTAVARVSIAVLGVLVVAATIAVSVTESPRASFFAGAGPLALLMIGAGLSLLAAGLGVMRVRPGWRSGPLLVLAAVLWFSPVWVAWEDGPLVVRSLGMLGTLFTPLVLTAVIVGFPDSSTGMSRRRRVLVAVAAALAVAAAVFILFYDPFHDVECWATCGGNAFLIVPMPPLARVALMTTGGLNLFGLGFAMVCALRDATIRRSMPRVLAAGAATALGLGAALTVAMAGQGPGSEWSGTQQAASATGALLLATAFASQFWLVRTQQTAIDEIVRTASDAEPDAIQDALRRATGDPTLSLAYWLPESERFIDGGGRPWEPAAVPADVKIATITRQGRTVAAISHSALTEVESHLRPAVRVAIENRSLRVELEVQLKELRAARTRIVVAQDDRRRELERALHDGAQHRLTVLVLQLRALVDIAGDAGLDCVDDLQRGIALARSAIDELRELARGVYPAILESGGLPSALMTYAASAPIAVELDAIAADRADRAVEMTAYRFAVSAVEDASRRSASHAGVSVVATERTLRVAVTDDAVEAPDLLPTILDRVGAVGGTVRSAGGRIVVELPCGS